ncbi:MAG: hypothetical protein FWH03_02665 [Firmicutes bacterium]|nr:hypothetical protein [Bacillota bacterium]
MIERILLIVCVCSVIVLSVCYPIKEVFSEKDGASKKKQLKGFHLFMLVLPFIVALINIASLIVFLIFS